jgi:TolB protein
MFYDPGFDCQWPVLSPDGTKIAFQKAIGVTVTTQTDIMVYTIASHALVNLSSPVTPNGFRNDAPYWSPDGTKLVFDSNRNGTFDIWRMNADGSSQTALTNTPNSDGYPVYSHDGTKIAFTRDREVWYMNADGTIPVQVTQMFQF